MVTLQTYSDRTDGPGAWGDLTYKARRTFTMKLATGGDEAEQLRAEVSRLNKELVVQEFERAVSDGRILPRDREAFFNRMGDDATLVEARAWIGKTPAPMLLTRRPLTSAAPARQFARADEQLVALAKEEMARNPGTDYATAQTIVLRRYPALADEYRHMTGTL